MAEVVIDVDTEVDVVVAVDVIVVAAAVVVTVVVCWAPPGDPPDTLSDSPIPMTVPGIDGTIALAPEPTIVNIICLPLLSCPVVTPIFKSEPKFISCISLPLFLSKNLM